MQKIINRFYIIEPTFHYISQTIINKTNARCSTQNNKGDGKYRNYLQRKRTR